MKREDQQDATIRCLLLTSVSTCFGHHYAHLQENKGPVTACGVLFWFCWMWLVAVVGHCVVGCEQCSHPTTQRPTTVGTAMIIVADVKYARVSTSIPTVNMWCAHTTNPNNPIAIVAKIIPKFPNASFFPLSWQMMCEIIPNSGRMRI